MALVAATMMSAAPTVASAAPYKLFIDPGHGGRDPGAVKAGFTEKASNLRISRLVAKAARRQGWAVKMSRYSDRYVGLNTRARMANRWRANAFVSVHANSTGKKSLGYMTIYRGKNSRRMGRNIMVQTGRLSRYRDIGNKRDVRGLAVLRGTRMPAVLVETLAVTSPRERAVLKDPRKQAEIAEAIVRGIARYRGVNYIPPKAAKRATVKPTGAKSTAKKPVTAKRKATPSSAPSVGNGSAQRNNGATATPSAREASGTPRPSVTAPSDNRAPGQLVQDGAAPDTQVRLSQTGGDTGKAAAKDEGTTSGAAQATGEAPKNVEVLMKLLGIDTIVEILTS